MVRKFNMENHECHEKHEKLSKGIISKPKVLEILCSGKIR